MDKIHQLDSVVADQIAAGEVVQRPASAVKELLENAVDAKASDITLVLGNNGSALIRVVDNGCGMSPSDAKRSFLRHATSKIKCSADLFALHTFGFRGEALASIASVSHVEMITRRAEDELAVKLTVHGGEVISQEFVAAAVGTSIAVENLFYNVPARRRFLKEGNAERRAIISELEHVALVNENVSFSFATLESGSQIVFGATSLRQRVEDVAGKRLSKKLLPIDLQTNIVSLGGWISTHEGALSTSRGANFFVNGRFMRSLSLQKAVTMGYGRLLDAGKYPQFYIYINVDPTSIDVNVHPTKTEIKFENENEIWQILQSTVRRTLGRDNIVPQMDFDNPTPIEIPIYSASNTNVRQPTTGARMNYNPFENQVWESVSDKEPLIEENLPDELFEMTPIDKGSEPSQAALPMEVAIDFSVFQFSTRYLCTTTVDGLVLVDYTRAIERIEYERLINTLQQGTTPSQMELFPENVELSQADASLLLSHSDLLSAMGFDLGDMGGGRVVIYAMPASMATGVGSHQAIEDLVTALSENTHKGGDQSEAIAAALAHSASRVAPRTLDPLEQQTLLTSLFACQEPNYTPSSLPVFTIISNGEIEKKFRR